MSEDTDRERRIRAAVTAYWDTWGAEFQRAMGHRSTCADASYWGHPARYPLIRVAMDAAIEAADFEAKVIRTPFTIEQIEALNRYQIADHLHPFTCGNEHSSDLDTCLRATSEGWRCPHCSYTQDWAWRFMLETWLGRTIPNHGPQPSIPRPDKMPPRK